MSRGRFGKAPQIAASVLLSAAVAVSMCGCKTTDFFTEILIHPDAKEIDENNPDKTIINSPDAQEESGDLAALKWGEESHTTEDVQNLVVWSRKPNSDLNTHHSFYDPKPLFPGISASDGVRLVFNHDATLDHSVEGAEGESNDSMTSVSAGDSDTPSTDPNMQVGFSADATATGGSMGTGTGGGGVAPSEEQGSGEDEQDAGEEEGDTNEGGDGSGEDEGEGESDEPSEEEGDTTDKYAGFGGSLTVYDPNNAKQDIPNADSIAVIGKRAAVLVQAIGGEGAICAMSKEAYFKTDENTEASFEDIFSDECDSSVVSWGKDDKSIKEIDPEKLIKNIGENTLILYDQDLCTGSDDPNKSFFTEEQLKELYAAGVVGFAPLSFSSEYGIVDGAYFVGEALADSKNLKDGWSSRDMAEAYVDTVTNIITATIDTNSAKGNWVYGNEAANKKSTEFKGSEVSKKGTETYLHGLIATDAKTGLSYKGDGGEVDASRIVLFGGYGQNNYTPLGFWMQAAGVADTLIAENSIGGADDGATSAKFLTLLWGTSSKVTKKNLKGSGGAYSNWHGAVSSMTIGGIGNGADSLGKEFGGGLGSKNMPYLIVNGSADGKISASKVKSAVVSSINSSSPYTPYSYYAYDEEILAAIAPYDSSVISSIGHTNYRQAENPFVTGLNAEDVVRINPTGLLGSWTKGNFESVLETAWLASIYTQSPDGCEYEPEYDWSSFSVEMGDETVESSDHGGDEKDTVRDLVVTFYKTFYRCDVDYDSVVSDQGL